MKNVVLSADSERKVYSVPDAVADGLEEYCMEFCTKWLIESPNAKKYRLDGGLCYDENDFIEYLNEWIFPNERSEFITNLGWINFGEPFPEPYDKCPAFNF